MNFIEISQEIEVIVQNTTDEELKDLTVTITHVKEFFEKEIMNQDVEIWFPQEELLFVSPTVPHINEYWIIIRNRDGEGEEEKIVNQRIDLNSINKI
jgi:hypothetical protein